MVAAYTPLRVYATNVGKFPHPERLGLIVAVYFVLGLLWFLALNQLTIGQRATLVSSVAFVLLVSSGGRLASATTTLVAVLTVFGVAIAFALLVNRIGDEVGKGLLVGILTFLVLGVAVPWVQEWFAGTEQSVLDVSNSSLPSSLETLPDIYVVLLDGFPGPRAVSDIYQSDLDLRQISGVVRTEAWASYPMTIGSVSSLFEMGYPLSDQEVVDGVSSRHLSRIMSGDNRFTEILDQNGYQITHVESGYSNSFCYENADLCVKSGFLDEGTFWVLNQSVMSWELRERAGSAFTQGALHTMDWLRKSLPSIANNDQVDFVFASVLLPHPPMLLDENCDFAYEYWRTGNSVFAGDAIVEPRQDAFIDQAQCAADFEADIFEMLPNDTVVVFLSDHGGDSLGQMSKYERVWSQEDIVERMSVHFAIRAPAECDFGDEVFLSQVLRDLLWCLSGSDPNAPDPPTRMFTASRIRDSSDYLLEEMSRGEMKSIGVEKG